MGAFNFVADLMSILFSKEGLQGKGFDLFVWLVGQICSALMDEASALRELDDGLKRVNKIKEGIDALQKDADERRKIEDRTVMQWLRELSTLALDAEDLLDLTRTRRRDLARQQQQNSTGAPTAAPHRYKRKFSWGDLVLSSVYQYPSSAPQLLFERLAAKETAAITGRLDEITKRKKCLQTSHGARVPHSEDAPVTAAVPIQLIGMVSDRETIINLLVTSPLMVVAIKGMAGSGKTATAQSACNDDRVTAFFHKIIWIDVKRGHCAKRITSEMLESLGEHSHFWNFETSLRRLTELVSCQRLLVVLDNTEDGFLPSWETVRTRLRSVAPGSKVLVTTTSGRVATEMGDITYQLRGLSDEEWLQLFTSKTGDLNAFPHLQELATEIGQRCQNSPFAAKSLGSLISKSRDEKEWDDVLGGQTREGTQNQCDEEIRKMLRRSYEFLPLRLKRCFAFCAIFPNDHDLDKDELTKIWVALGFAYAEGVSRLYFRELELKSFFEDVYARRNLETGTQAKGRYYRVPRLMHDLARSVSAHECLSVNTQGGHEYHDALSTEVRHILLSCRNRGTEPEMLDLHQADHTWTFIMLQGLKPLTRDLFLKMPCLRVLDLSCTTICKLPDSVGELTLLRYLNLSGTLVARLPASLTSLSNLQTLNLDDCYFLNELPEETSNLTSLCHLSLRLSHPRRSTLASMPPNIGKLTGLKTLSRFIVGERSQGCGLNQLLNLKNIRGDLWLSKLENANPEDARTANLTEKKYQTLTLEWTSGVQSQQNPRDVIEQLQPCCNLRALCIEGYNRETPPTWMSHMESLETLHLSHCQNWESLTVLERLPRLKHLHVEHLGNVTVMRPSDFKSDKYRALETLILRNMANLEEWFIYQGQMPNLQKLCFIHCPKLRNPRSVVPPSARVVISGCSFV